MTTFAPTQTSLFEREEHAYEQHRQELLQQAQGQYVLIKEDAIIGLFPTFLAAVERGTELYINQPFYTRQITTQEEPIVVPSNFTVFQS